MTSIFTAYAAKHHFDEIQYLDIVDCNAGDHHKAFATNFNPEINIREITQKGLYWENGKWVETEPLEIHQPLTIPASDRAKVTCCTTKRSRAWSSTSPQSSELAFG